MEVTLAGPYGNFVAAPDPAQQRHLVLFAAGSGITPLYSILRSVLYHETGSNVSLVYANHAADRIIFYEQLQELEQKFADRFTVYHALSEIAAFPGESKTLVKGPLSRLIVKKLTQLLLERHKQQPSFYLCGPAAFMQLVESAVASLDFPASSIFKEHFINEGESTDAPSFFDTLPARDVSVSWQGKRHCVPVPPGTSILQAALDQGLALPHSCKDGLCGVCRASLVNGVVQMQRNSVLTADELASGQVLLCQGYALSEGVEVRPLGT
jgi:ring-1,2-phenylacetyl-CoA epoxidase subunit PaaE